MCHVNIKTSRTIIATGILLLSMSLLTNPNKTLNVPINDNLNVVVHRNRSSLSLNSYKFSQGFLRVDPTVHHVAPLVVSLETNNLVRNESRSIFMNFLENSGWRFTMQ